MVVNYENRCTGNTVQNSIYLDKRQVDNLEHLCDQYRCFQTKKEPFCVFSFGRIDFRKGRARARAEFFERICAAATRCEANFELK